MTEYSVRMYATIELLSTKVGAPLEQRRSTGWLAPRAGYPLNLSRRQGNAIGHALRIQLVHLCGSTARLAIPSTCEGTVGRPPDTRLLACNADAMRKVFYAALPRDEPGPLSWLSKPR